MYHHIQSFNEQFNHPFESHSIPVHVVCANKRASRRKGKKRKRLRDGEVGNVNSFVTRRAKKVWTSPVFTHAFSCCLKLPASFNRSVPRKHLFVTNFDWILPKSFQKKDTTRNASERVGGSIKLIYHPASSHKEIVSHMERRFAQISHQRQQQRRRFVSVFDSGRRSTNKLLLFLAACGRDRPAGSWAELEEAWSLSASHVSEKYIHPFVLQYSAERWTQGFVNLPCGQRGHDGESRNLIIYSGNFENTCTTRPIHSFARFWRWWFWEFPLLLGRYCS